MRVVPYSNTNNGFMNVVLSREMRRSGKTSVHLSIIAITHHNRKFMYFGQGNCEEGYKARLNYIMCSSTINQN